jgi:hypothetical protein
MTARLRRSCGVWGSLVVALLLAASPAWAAPAVVKVFEAAAREAPRPDAAVVHVFPEQTKISVSEEVTDGWRKVRLPDGNTGYLRDDQVKLLPEAPPATTAEEANTPAKSSETTDEDALLASPRATAPPVEPLPKASPRPRPTRVRTTIYVKDLDHLAELVSSDGRVHPMAEDLATRHTIANVALWGGNVVGGALILAGATVLTTKDCVAGVGNYPGACTDKPSLTAMTIGIGVALAGTIAWLAVRPTRSDLLDTINTWNERHPDEPFTLDEPGRRD